jgi:predicted metalloprotease
MTRIRSTRSSRVVDRRGSASRTRSSSFGGRSPFGTGGGVPIKAGGGVVGLLVVLAIVFLPQLLGGGGDSGGPASPAAQAPTGATECVTEIEQVVCGAVDDVSRYWEQQYPQSFQGAFPGTETVLFSGAVDTGCGYATAQTGPFYCPADQLVYVDLDFLQQLQTEFSATGDLAAQYIVAHEYGHHVQNVTGISGRVRQVQQQSPGAANEFSVALELQADCFAGAWAASAAEREQFDRPDEISEALEAAEAVGDDRILAQSGRVVDPDLFTHGTAAQRRTWFERGYESGDPERCTTFDGALAP